jgi:hypothetical protein
MNRTALTFAIVAAAALAGCNDESHTIDAGRPGDDNSAIAGAPPVALPPSIAHSGIYRCKDNSVVYVDWLSDSMTANLRTEKTGTPIQLKSAEAGKAMTADGGYSLTGTKDSAAVTLARPGKGSQSCKA